VYFGLLNLDVLSHGISVQKTEMKKHRQPWIHFEFVPSSPGVLLVLMANSNRVLRVCFSNQPRDKPEQSPFECVCEHELRIRCFAVNTGKVFIPFGL
jgi:hypothetical protein